ncbi:MAG TPA: APC family permease [Rhizomicrobium sp.]|nr:APC family permease [Rhizomicrobium sp.]
MTSLKRAIGPGQMMLYGVGSMMGAGIYGLVGKAAGVLGSAMWMAFLVAMAAALLTGLSYASIASRYPRAAGAAYAAHRAYGRPWLSYVVGLAVVASGIASSATQSKVVALNLNSLLGWHTGLSVAGVPLEIILLAVGFLMLVGGIVYRGISESLWANTVCTLIEAGGLILVIAVGFRFWGDTDLTQLPVTPANPDGALTGALLLQGAVLTFFSFLGFEDMLNVSEEVKKPERNMPIAMIGAMLIVSVIYLAVSVTAVSIVPWQELAQAPAPLRAVIERAAPWFPAIGFTFITIAAVANTALVNTVMGSRMLYGLSRQGLLPAALGKVHGRRRTPHVAILVLFVIIALLQFTGDITQLAGATVLLLLIVFTIVNSALVVLKRRDGDMPGRFNAPVIVPVLGAAVCLVMIGGQLVQSDWRGPAIAIGMIAAILVAYLFSPQRGQAIPEA